MKDMTKFIVEYKDGYKEKTETYLKGAESRLKMMLNLYFKVGYTEIPKKKQFEFHFEPRSALAKLIEVAGANVESQMMAVGMKGMMKLNEEFKKEGIQARVVGIK